MSFAAKCAGAVLLACASALAGPPCPARAAKVDFLLPGMSLESAAFVPGARVSYLVISKSFGAADSSYLELRVLDRAKGAFRLEVVSSPYPRSKKESTTIRLRIADRITSLASPDSFASCLLGIQIKEGTGSFREPSAREIDDMDLESMFLRTDDSLRRAPLGTAVIKVPAGVFSCEGAEHSRESSRPVSLGGVPARRIEEEKIRVWISRDVPFWGLVKSSIDRKSRTTAAGAGDSASRPRETATESVLLSYTKPRRRS